MEKHLCPFCHQELEMEHRIKFVDYYCRNDEHYFAKRLCKGELLAIKIRLTEPDGEKLYLKVHFNEGYSEVWKHSNQVARFRINHTFVLDYNNPEAIKKKIRTCITFG